MNEMNHPGTPIGQVLARRQAALGLSDVEIAKALGYQNDKVVALMKSGSLRVPVNKIAALAQVLQMDGGELLEAALTESAPGLWDAIQDLVLPLGRLGPGEVNLLRHLRQLRGETEAAPIVFSGKGVIALVAVD